MTPDNKQADQDHDEDDIATSTDNTVVPLVPLEVESNSLNDSREQELVTLRSTRQHRPPARLIEEITLTYAHTLFFLFLLDTIF